MVLPPARIITLAAAITLEQALEKRRRHVATGTIEVRYALDVDGNANKRTISSRTEVTDAGGVETILDTEILTIEP